TIIVDVLASAGFRDSSFARLKVLTGGGATMPAAVAERLKARFNLDYIEGYAMTETMSPTHLNPLAAPKRQCLGIAVHETDARVIDPDTLEGLADGAVGEIIVHGPQVLISDGVRHPLQMPARPSKQPPVWLEAVPLNARRVHAVPSGKPRVHLRAMHRRAEAPSLT